MGSYLSVANDTQDTWMCKIGPDESAIDIVKVVIDVLTAVATIVGATAGAGLVANSGGGGHLTAALTSEGHVAVYNVPGSALSGGGIGQGAIAATHAAVQGQASGFGVAMAKSLSDRFAKDGYTVIEPGQNHRWGKMTLSLWQQAACVRSVILDEKTVRADTLYMRPIFSGATKDSTKKYKIQSWLNKKGVSSVEIKAEDKKKMRMLREEPAEVNYMSGTSTKMLPPTDKLFYFYANGTNSFDN